MFSCAHIVDMNGKIIFQFFMLILSIVMFCYQVSKAFKSLMNPPMMVIMESVNITDVPAPLVYFCPLDQYNKDKINDFGYEDEFLMLLGALYDKPIRSWGAHKNLTFQQLVDNVIDLDLQKFIRNVAYSTRTVFFPKFGYCLNLDEIDVTYTAVIDTINYPIGFMILLTDSKTRTYFSVDMASQIGDRIRLEEHNQPKVYTFSVDIEMHILSNKSNCQADLNYSYEDCVNEFIHTDLLNLFGCIPPYLSANNHCANTREENDVDAFFFYNYAQPYFTFGQTIAEEKCLKPCVQQKIIVSLRDEVKMYKKGSSTARITFTPLVKVYSNQPAYDWFNFVVDVGSSFGTWVGLSCISLIYFALNPIAAIMAILHWFRL